MVWRIPDCISDEAIYCGDLVEHQGKRYMVTRCTTTRTGRGNPICDVEAIWVEASAEDSATRVSNKKGVSK